MRESGTSLRWDAEALWDSLSPILPGLSIEVVEQIESTNTELLARLRGVGMVAANGGPGRRAADLQPCLLVAAHQTRGRGRQGHSWQSTPGHSLTFSLALALPRPDTSGLSLAVGVALAEALDPGAQHLQLKWPNDLWLVKAGIEPADAGPAPVGTAGECKLGGILTETVQIGSRRMAVIGVGLNVLPQRLSDTDIDAASLSEIDSHASLPGTLSKVALPMVRALREFEAHGFAAFEARYAARDLLRGRLLITTDADCPGGRGAGIDREGALLVDRDDGVRTRIIGGAVSVRPLGAAPAVEE